MQDLEKWKISNQRQFMHNDGEGFLIGFHYDDVVGLINRLQSAEKELCEHRAMFDRYIDSESELKALREQKPAAWAFDKVGCRAPDDCEEYLQIIEVDAVNQRELDEYLKHGRAHPLYAAPVAQSRDSAEQAGPATQMQWREIGESDWATTADKSWFEHCQKSPEHDTRVWSQPEGAAPERDFPEDAAQENGNYENRCFHCEQVFLGNKHRRVCKSCEQQSPAPKAQCDETLQAAISYVGQGDDVRMGWIGRSPSHKNLFQCERCGAEHEDCTLIPHHNSCSAIRLLSAIVKADNAGGSDEH